jgi:hypothetical protein
MVKKSKLSSFRHPSNIFPFQLFATARFQMKLMDFFGLCRRCSMLLYAHTCVRKWKSILDGHFIHAHRRDGKFMAFDFNLTLAD